jgi:hypothetical protein
MFDSNLGRSHGVEDITAASIQVIVKGLIPGIVNLLLLVFIFLSVNLCDLMTFASFFRTTFVK